MTASVARLPKAKAPTRGRLRAHMVKNKTQKGQGASARRAEKRKKKFAPELPGKGARANVLRDESTDAHHKKRRRDDVGSDGAAPPRKALKQGPFARPAAAAAAPPRSGGEPAVPLSRKELKQLGESRKAARKPNHALIQVRARRPQEAPSSLAAAGGGC